MEAPERRGKLLRSQSGGLAEACGYKIASVPGLDGASKAVKRTQRVAVVQSV